MMNTIQNASNPIYAPRMAQADTKKKAEEAAKDTTGKVEVKDGFEKQPATTPVTYNKTTGKAQAADLRDLMNDRIDSFNKMIQSMVVGQGQASNLTLFGQRLFVTPEQSAAAAKSIAPGGEYSVDSVAGRIFDMAKALSGGDPSKIKELRNAVEKGFKAAGVDFGQKMPAITGQTHSEVMRRFDEWEQESSKTA